MQTKPVKRKSDKVASSKKQIGNAEPAAKRPKQSPTKNIQSATTSPSPPQRKKKKHNKKTSTEIPVPSVGNQLKATTKIDKPKIEKPETRLSADTKQHFMFTVLEDKKLIKKITSVSMTNNQKGRIRQQLKDTYKGTDPTILPYLIDNRIKNILKEDNLMDADLRKIRVLFNMLKTAVKECKDLTTDENTNDKGASENKPKKDDLEKAKTQIGEDGDAAQLAAVTPVKVKGPKRYVVFVGNLPAKVTEQMILDHFSVLRNYIKSVRIPQTKDETKKIAYVEFMSQPSFEVALSKHHTMLGNRRINVLYTTQKGSKITKEEAKATRAKLVALVKTGKLPGSIPLVKKRSHRRKMQKNAAKMMSNM